MDYNESVGEELSEYVLHQLLTVELYGPPVRCDSVCGGIPWIIKAIWRENVKDIASRFHTSEDFVGRTVTAAKSGPGRGLCQKSQGMSFGFNWTERPNRMKPPKPLSGSFELLGKKPAPCHQQKIKITDGAGVVEACDHIKDLNPKPSRGFDARGV